MFFTLHCDSPLGGILLAADEIGLTGLWFDGQLHFGRTLAPQYGLCALPVFERAAAWLDCYFGGGRPDFEVPLRWRDGTEHWIALRGKFVDGAPLFDSNGKITKGPLYLPPRLAPFVGGQHA